MFEGLPVGCYTFIARAKDNLHLPSFKGSTLRGGFGHAFKKVVCTVRGKPCPECLLYRRCVYSYIFETPPPEDSEVLRKYRAIPHPFVIEPPLDTKTDYSAGELLNFNLILIGRAIDYLPYFIYTFEELGRIGIGKGRGKYELQEVVCEGKQIYNSLDRRLNSSNLQLLNFSTSQLPNSSTHNSKLLTLHFLTPTRIRFNEDLVLDLEFHHLIRNLLRRLSSLSYFHCGKRLDIDFKGLISRAERVKTRDRDLKWYDWERYSARQDTRMKMGGFVGRVIFEPVPAIIKQGGDLSEFMPFIEIGEVVHVGKGTSFGLGRYKVE